MQWIDRLLAMAVTVPIVRCLVMVDTRNQERVFGQSFVSQSFVMSGYQNHARTQLNDTSICSENQIR